MRWRGSSSTSIAGGVYWGDCSLANTLFRRDGDRIQAYLVDAETSEVHPSLSDGQREYDLEILVENVAFGLADLAALQGRDEGPDDAIAAADAVVRRYRVLWDELHVTPDLPPGDRQAVRRRIRKLNDLGFSVDEIEVEPSGRGPNVRLKLTVARRAFHARELRRLTGIVALENQARLLLNDLREYGAWLHGPSDARSTPPRSPNAGAPRSTSRRSPGSPRSSGRTGTSSRRTATCSSTSGCSPYLSSAHRKFVLLHSFHSSALAQRPRPPP